jgi:hypothetical protein
MGIFNMAAQMSTQIDQFQNDIDTLEFLKHLRDEILEQYLTIAVGIEDWSDKKLKHNFSQNVH